MSQGLELRGLSKYLALELVAFCGHGPNSVCPPVTGTPTRIRRGLVPSKQVLGDSVDTDSGGPGNCVSASQTFPCNSCRFLGAALGGLPSPTDRTIAE
jgi:hypothetical protein